MYNNHDFKKIEGKYINLREAEISDSEFILSLRTDEKKSRYIHQTDSDLNKQIEYMKRYKTLKNEWYYIIENKHNKSLGTISIYPHKNTTQYEYEIGRWLMSNESNVFESIESDLLVKKIFFEEFNFISTPITVHKNNTNVIKFHNSWNAKKISTYDDFYILELTREIYLQNKDKFYSFIYRNK